MSQPQNTTAEATEGREDPILSVRDLQTVFYTDNETIRAVDSISFDVGRGETVGIVGESGSGKSVTARSIMGLIESPGKVLPGSSISFDGQELTDLSEKQYQSIRGSGIGMVFQDPNSRLTPSTLSATEIRESLAINRDITGEKATTEATRLLRAVGIPDAKRRLDEYPHEFSGGMRQRAVIAMMLACDPDFLICDEPTTALDVTIQAQILELLKELQEERGLSILFITHDMGVVADIANRVNVMYAGQIVEKATVEDLFANPQHPYTRARCSGPFPVNTPVRTGSKQSRGRCRHRTNRPITVGSRLGVRRRSTPARTCHHSTFLSGTARITRRRVCCTPTT